MTSYIAESATAAQCPRCHTDAAEPLRALRSSAVYSCRECEYQWEVEPENAEPDPVSRSLDSALKGSS